MYYIIIILYSYKESILRFFSYTHFSLLLELGLKDNIIKVFKKHKVVKFSYALKIEMGIILERVEGVKSSTCIKIKPEDIPVTLWEKKCHIV